MNVRQPPSGFNALVEVTVNITAFVNAVAAPTAQTQGHAGAVPGFDGWLVAGWEPPASVQGNSGRFVYDIRITAGGALEISTFFFLAPRDSPTGNYRLLLLRP